MEAIFDYEWLHSIEHQLGVIDVVLFLLLIIYFILKYSVKYWRFFLRYIIDIFFPSDRVVIFGSSNASILFFNDAVKNSKKATLVLYKTEKHKIHNISSNRNGKILYVDKINDKVLGKIRIDACSSCLIMFDDDEQNLIISKLIINIKKKSDYRKLIRVFLYLENDYLRDICTDQDMDSFPFVELNYLNFDRFLVSSIYDTHPPIRYVNNTTLKNRKEFIAIIGYNEMAKLFIVENIRLSHHNKNPLNILCMFKDAESVVSDILTEFPFTNNIINLIPVEYLSTTFNASLPWDTRLLDNINNLDVAYFFGNNDTEIIASSLRFKQFLFSNTGLLDDIKFIICVRQSNNILNLINHESSTGAGLFDKYDNNLSINVVRVLDEYCNYDSIVGNSNIANAAIIFTYINSVKNDFDKLLSKQCNQHENKEFIESILNTILNSSDYGSNILSSIEEKVIIMIKEYTNQSIYKTRNIFSFSNRWLSSSQRSKETSISYARSFVIKMNILSKLGSTEVNKKILIKHKDLFFHIEGNHFIGDSIASGYVYRKVNNNDDKVKGILENILRIKSNEGVLQWFESESSIDQWVLLHILFSKIFKKNARQ